MGHEKNCLPTKRTAFHFSRLGEREEEQRQPRQKLAW